MKYKETICNKCVWKNYANFPYEHKLGFTLLYNIKRLDDALEQEFL